jgi:hypothetical protein
MAPRAINTHTLAALPTLAKLGVTILLIQTFFQLAEIATRGSTAQQPEPSAMLHVKVSSPGGSGWCLRGRGRGRGRRVESHTKNI